LPGYDRANDESNHDRNAEVHRNACILQVEAECVPGELRCGPSSESCGRLNPPTSFPGGHAGGGLGEDEGEQIALAPDKPERLAVARVQDGEALKGSRRVADSDDQDAFLVHLQCLTCLEGLAGEEVEETSLINDGCVWLVQVVE